MGHDAVHVALHEPGEPLEVPVSRSAAGVRDPLHQRAHPARIGAGIGLREHLLHDVAGGKELVLGYELPVALPGAALLQDLLLPEEPAALRDDLSGTCVPVLPLPGILAGHEDVLGVLEGPGRLCVALLREPCLLVLPDLRDDLLAGVLDEMEAVVDDVEMRVPLEECPLEICVHVAGDGLHMGHPFIPDVVAEVVHDLLPLRACKPERMPCLQIDNHGGVHVPVVQPGLVYAQIPCLALRLPEHPLSIPALLRIERLEPRPVDLLHDVPVQSCHEGHRLERLAQGEQVLHEREERQRYAVSRCPERHLLCEGVPAFPACPSPAGYLYPRPLHAQGKMPERDGDLPVALHRLPAAGA